MAAGILGKLDYFARGTVPILTTLAVVLVSVVPTRIPAFGYLTPALTLMAVYYWAIYRPDLMPMLGVFLLGLLQDLLIGGLLGTHAFIFLLTYGLVVSQRRFFHNKSFGVVWWGFMLIATGAAILSWLIAALHATAILDTRGPLVSLALTILLYPPMAALLSQAHKVVPARDADM